MLETDGRPLNVKTRHLHAILVDEAFVRREIAERNLWPFNRFALRQIDEVLLNPRFGLRRIEVADYREDSVVRSVVKPEERFYIFLRRGAEIRHRADHRPRIRVILRIHRGGEDLTYATVRLVVVTLPALVLDDVALCIEFRDVEFIEQKSHAICFQPQR